MNRVAVLASKGAPTPGFFWLPAGVLLTRVGIRSAV